MGENVSKKTFFLNPYTVFPLGLTVKRQLTNCPKTGLVLVMVFDPRSETRGFLPFPHEKQNTNTEGSRDYLP